MQEKRNSVCNINCGHLGHFYVLFEVEYYDSSEEFIVDSLPYSLLLRAFVVS